MSLLLLHEGRTLLTWQILDERDFLLLEVQYKYEGVECINALEGVIKNIKSGKETRHTRFIILGSIPLCYLKVVHSCVLLTFINSP